jgi:hypothetical protein
MRLLRNLLVSGSAAVMAGALTFSAGPMMTTASAHQAGHAAAPSAKFLREARTALVKFLRHNHPTIQLVHPGQVKVGVAGTTKAQSTNWSGYANTSSSTGAFTKVSGSWVTPKIQKCTKEDQLTSEWVGLDGFNTGTVEQDGTLDWCFQGKQIYFTWYEMFPAPTIEVGKTLKPGDKITASVSRKGTAYTLAVTDSSTKSASFSVKKSCAAATCLDKSAEWIAERPSFSTGFAPLVDFGKWKVTNGKVTEKGKAGKIGSFSNDAITMIDSTGTYNLATVSALSGGNSFTATWKDSY